MASQDEVNAACEAIRSRGERPTVDRVTAALGGGSPNRLTPMVRAWKAAQQSGGTEPEPTVGPSGPETLPAVVQRAVDSLSMVVAALVPAFGAAIAEVAETERRRTRLEVEAATTGADARVEEAHRDAADERSATDSLRVEVSEREAEVTRLTAIVQNTTGRMAAMEKELAQTTSDLAQGCQDYQDATDQITVLTQKMSEIGAAAQKAQTEAAASQAVAAAAQDETRRLREQLALGAAEMKAVADSAIRERQEAAAALASLRTDLAVSVRDAENERKRADREEERGEQARQERLEAEASSRDAVSRAARAETATEVIRAELDLVLAARGIPVSGPGSLPLRSTLVGEGA